MKQLIGTPLFYNITEQNIKKLLSCIQTKKKQFRKNEFILIAGSKVSVFGIITEGSIYIIQEDFWGNRTILTKIDAGGLFGEVFACAGIEVLPVSVIACEKTEILFLNYQEMIAVCSEGCPFHIQLIHNIIAVLAEKNFLLTKKIEYLTKRSIREKLMAFLSDQASEKNMSEFDITYNRQQLADYLAVDRSALSSELGKLCKEGILNFNKNHFILLKK